MEDTGVTIFLLRTDSNGRKALDVLLKKKLLGTECESTGASDASEDSGTNEKVRCALKNAGISFTNCAMTIKASLNYIKEVIEVLLNAELVDAGRTILFILRKDDHTPKEKKKLWVC